MNINEFAQEVHANAVAHGWWDNPRPQGEVMSLIHSEWSEALEEARAGKPLDYIIANTDVYRDPEDLIIPRNAEGKYITSWGEEYQGKPEGIAVELADGCIRILDYLAHVGVGLTPEHNSLAKLCEEIPRSERHLALSECVAILHWHTSIAYSVPTTSNTGRDKKEIMRIKITHLYLALAVACVWITENGGDAEKTMLEKHEYNKSRPYKHGKKF